MLESAVLALLAACRPQAAQPYLAETYVVM